MTLHDGFTHFSFEVWAVRCQTRDFRCDKEWSAVLSDSKMRGIGRIHKIHQQGLIPSIGHIPKYVYKGHSYKGPVENRGASWG